MPGDQLQKPALLSLPAQRVREPGCSGQVALATPRKAISKLTRGSVNKPTCLGDTSPRKRSTEERQGSPPPPTTGSGSPALADTLVGGSTGLLGAFGGLCKSLGCNGEDLGCISLTCHISSPPSERGCVLPTEWSLIVSSPSPALKRAAV
ncbi:hypothetical protein VULLAG_LOCUS15389 [Vulpes lagopus]